MPPRSAAAREDWCWLAGIWEGEGSAGLRLNKGRWAASPRRASLYASVSQTNRAMLEEVQRIAGSGKIHPCTHRLGRKPQWAWYCACRAAREFLTALLPFVRSPHKRDQLVVALAEDVRAREEGARVRRTNLALCRTKRWEAYRRAKVS